MTSPTKFYHVTNYIVDLIIWPKFSNSNISMREVNIISILFDQKNTDFEGWTWFKFNNLGGQHLWLWNLHQCAKTVKIKSQKDLKAKKKLYWKSSRGNISWIGLNELKLGNFFLDFINVPIFLLTAEDCGI